MTDMFVVHGWSLYMVATAQPQGNVRTQVTHELRTIWSHFALESLVICTRVTYAIISFTF